MRVGLVEAIYTATIQGNEAPILVHHGTSSDDLPLHKFKRWHWWLLVSINIFFLLAGQCAAVLLGRYYYDKGGNSKWMATLVQTVAFPVLLIPLLFLPSSQKPSTESASSSIAVISFIYIVLGVVIAGDNMLYSVGLFFHCAVECC